MQKSQRLKDTSRSMNLLTLFYDTTSGSGTGSPTSSSIPWYSMPLRMGSSILTLCTFYPIKSSAGFSFYTFGTPLMVDTCIIPLRTCFTSILSPKRNHRPPSSFCYFYFISSALPYHHLFCIVLFLFPHTLIVTLVSRIYLYSPF